MNFETARKNLIEQQIRTWNVYSSEVIKSLYKVPRENFVPYKYRKYALSDFQVPLNINDSMLSPLVEGRVFQSALTKNCGEILEIGSGSGYMAALLAQVYKSVITIEIDKTLFEQANENLKRNKINNVQVFQGDGLKIDNRWSNKKFDAIVISGGIKSSPLFLRDSLSFNGRIIAFMENGPIMNSVILKKNYNYGFLEMILFETKVNYLKQENLPEKFKF